MPNLAIADLIAERLPTLVHPGDETHPATALPLPMFASTAIPADVAEHFAEEAGLAHANITKLVAEAIVALIEGEGASVIVPADAYATIVATAEVEREKHRQPRVCCQTCGNPLFRINVDTTNPVVNGTAFLEALASLSPECPHLPKAA